MRALSGHSAFVQGLAFSPDGASLASASSDRTIKLWDTRLCREKLTLRGHEGWVTSVAFHSSGKTLASGGHDGSVRLWDIPSGKLIAPAGRQDSVVSVAFAPSGQKLAWGGYNGTVDLLNLGPSTVFLEEVTTLRARLGLLFAVRFSPDGSILAAAGSGKTVRLWDGPSNQPLRSLEHGDAQGCRGLAFSPQGNLLALALGNGVQLWNPGSGHLLAHCADHSDVVSAVSIDPTGRLLLTGGWDHTVRLYEIDSPDQPTLHPRACFDWRLGKVFDLAFAPDGMTAAVAGDRPPYLVICDVE